MKSAPNRLQTGSLVLATASALYAQEPTQPAATPPPAPAPSPPPSAGLINDWLRDQSDGFKPWDIGGQVRARFEFRDNMAIAGTPGAVDFSPTSGDNGFLLLREKVHLGYSPCAWFSGFVEARDSQSIEDDRDPEPEQDLFDLHQAYLKVGDPKNFPLTGKVGRQELSYGDERLVGAFDWNNLGRVFDAAKFRYEQEHVWVEAFVGRVILVDDGSFNEPNDYDYFSGVYAASTTLCPKQVTEAYFLSRNTGAQSPRANEGGEPQAGGPGARDIYTVGTRMKSVPGALGAWDYSLEVAGQFGSFNVGIERADHLALASHVGGGYTLSDLAWKPRLGVEYNFASGDGDSTDDDHNTFENLFPTNHKFYGYMDFFSWQNIHNPRFTGSITPHKKLKVSLDWHLFWLVDTEDAFYQVSGQPRTAGGYGINPNADSYVGSELDLVADFKISPYASLQGGYGHFFVGDYVEDSLPRTTDADWVYAQMTFGF